MAAVADPDTKASKLGVAWRIVADQDINRKIYFPKRGIWTPCPPPIPMPLYSPVTFNQRNLNSFDNFMTGTLSYLMFMGFIVLVNIKRHGVNLITWHWIFPDFPGNLEFRKIHWKKLSIGERVVGYGGAIYVMIDVSDNDAVKLKSVFSVKCA